MFKLMGDSIPKKGASSQKMKGVYESREGFLKKRG
jgi:hypothetical protein